MNEKHAQLRQLAERAPKGEWRLNLEAVEKAASGEGKFVPLDVGIGTRGAHFAIAEFVWMVNGDSDAMLGPGTLAARNTAHYVAAANPTTILSLLDRIELLEKTLRDAGYTVTDDSIEPPDDAVIPLLNLKLETANNRVEAHKDFIELLGQHVRDVVALTKQSVEIMNEWEAMKR